MPDKFYTKGTFACKMPPNLLPANPFFFFGKMITFISRGKKRRKQQRNSKTKQNHSQGHIPTTKTHVVNI